MTRPRRTSHPGLGSHQEGAAAPTRAGRVARRAPGWGHFGCLGIPRPWSTERCQPAAIPTATFVFN